MKKLILATVFMSSSFSAFSSSDWTYEEKLSTGDTCFYMQNSETGQPFLALGNGVPDSVAEECTNNGSGERAEKEFAKHSHPQYAPQPKDENFNRGLDIYNACIAGANVDGGALAKIVGKYSGKPSDINKIRKAYNYGSVVARGPRDCTNYTMGY